MSYYSYLLLNHNWVTVLTLKVTWRHRSCDHSIPQQPFPIGVPLWPSAYLQPLSRYSAPKCLTSANRHCACAILRDLQPLCKIWVHIWIRQPHMAYSLWLFHWAPIKINWCLLLRPLMEWGRRVHMGPPEGFLKNSKNGKNPKVPQTTMTPSCGRGIARGPPDGPLCKVLGTGLLHYSRNLRRKKKNLKFCWEGLTSNRGRISSGRGGNL